MDPTTVAGLWHSFQASALTIFLLQWLKKQTWFPWMQHIGTASANRTIAIVAACFSAAGVSYAYNPDAHTILLSGISLTTIATATWHAFNQFILQETVYQATVNKATTPAPDAVPVVASPVVVPVASPVTPAKP